MFSLLPFLAQLIAAITWAYLLVATSDRLVVLLAVDLQGWGAKRRPADSLLLVAGRGRPMHDRGGQVEAKSGVDRSISSSRTR